MQMIQIDYISLVIGNAIGALIVFLLYTAHAMSKKKHSLTEMKALIRESHLALKAAAENQKRLYGIIKEVEANLE